MTASSAESAAVEFRAWHARPPVVLANVWDAASAVVVATAGSPAVATTSAGIAWAVGRPDGEHIKRDRVLQTLSEIIDAVEVPVSADIESGYGRGAADVADTVAAVLELGVAGINVEDRPGDGGPALRDAGDQAARIRAARDVADRAGVRLWINARTDTFLMGTASAADRLSDTLARADAYAAAGADSLFVPGVADLDVIESLTRGPLPVNVMVGPGSPSVLALSNVGVARISVGSGIAEAAYGLVARAARELLTAGTYTSMASDLDYQKLNEAMSRQ